MKRALITGITGQDGSYLAELLLDKGYEVYGLYRRSAAPKFDNIQHIKDDIQLVCGDVTDPTSINDIISSLHFDEVYNLAAQSFVGASFSQPRLTFEIDTLGVLNILEAIRKYSPKTRFYQASTSEMFGSNYSSSRGYKIDWDISKPNYSLGVPIYPGKIVDDKFQNEKTPFQPESPYGVAKVAAHQLCQLYRKAYNLHISCGILFNHESPRRGLEFVTRKITNFVGKLSLGDYSPKLELGNLKSSRDWGHAKDYVRGMWMMLQQEIPDDYILCTGETHTIEQFLEIAFSKIPLLETTCWQDYVRINPAFIRPSEVPFLKGSSAKAEKILGWKPEISFEQLVQEMVTEDIKRWKNQH